MKYLYRVGVVIYLLFVMYVNYDIYYSHRIIGDYNEKYSYVETLENREAGVVLGEDKESRRMLWTFGLYDLRRKVVETLLPLNVFFIINFIVLWKMRRKVYVASAEKGEGV